TFSPSRFQVEPDLDSVSATIRMRTRLASSACALTEVPNSRSNAIMPQLRGMEMQSFQKAEGETFRLAFLFSTSNSRYQSEFFEFSYGRWKLFFHLGSNDFFVLVFSVFAATAAAEAITAAIEVAIIAVVVIDFDIGGAGSAHDHNGVV